MSDLPEAPPPGAILEAAVYVSDLAAAELFYGDLLGLPRLMRVPGRHVFYRVGATILLVFDPDGTAVPASDPAIPVPPHGARGEGHVCFAATDAEITAIRARLEAAGVAAEADFRWPNGARSLYVRDPSGNSVEFAERALWG